ncbi:hypothetical protein [Kitasatospora sp. NPDC050463]|uniref:hypothetical protein n=1 Tax=Kitasatospora sp. NPDC050463 TaxID=3155786 RepID=UPI0033DA3344
MRRLVDPETGEVFDVAVLRTKLGKYSAGRPRRSGHECYWHPARRRPSQYQKLVAHLGPMMLLGLLAMVILTMAR